MQYNPDKLIDFCEKKLMHPKYQGMESKFIWKEEIWKKMHRWQLAEVIGENLFMVFGKEECYYHHYHIIMDLENLNDGEEYGRFTSLGWMVTNKGLEDMKSNN